MTNRLMLKKLEEMRKQQLELEEARTRAARHDRKWLKAGVLIAGIATVPAGLSSNSIAFASYSAGSALAAAGVVGLEQHVENPSQVPLMRLQNIFLQ